MGHGWLAAFLLSFVASSGYGRSTHLTDDQPKKQSKIDSPEEVAKALKALDAPRTKGGRGPQLSPGSLPPVWAEMREYLAYNYYLNSRDSIERLARTKADVDKELLSLGRSDERFQVRYRARYILARRGNSEVLPLLEAMQTDKDPDVRFLGWDAYYVAIESGKLGPPKDIGRCVRHYEGEKAKEVRDRIERIFASAKPTEAVKPLIESVRRNHDSIEAIRALGEIGNPRAVTVIIDDFAKSGNRHFHLEALGKLGTAPAVDFIIKHLDEYGAVNALCRTKSEKALPALRQHLAKLKAEKGPDYDLNGAATRIAIVRMSQKDPREELMRIAEDKDRSHWERWDAFSALREYDTKAYKKRFLKLFTTDPDTDVKRICIWLLEDSDLEGIKEAIMEYALVLEPRGMSELATEGCLLETLNNRLGTSFWEMTDLREYIKELRARKE